MVFTQAGSLSSSNYFYLKLPRDMLSFRNLHTSCSSAKTFFLKWFIKDLQLSALAATKTSKSASCWIGAINRATCFESMFIMVWFLITDSRRKFKTALNWIRTCEKSTLVQVACARAKISCTLSRRIFLWGRRTLLWCTRSGRIISSRRIPIWPCARPFRSHVSSESTTLSKTWAISSPRLTGTLHFLRPPCVPTFIKDNDPKSTRAPK